MSDLSLPENAFEIIFNANTRDGELVHAPWAIARTADEIMSHIFAGSCS